MGIFDFLKTKKEEEADTKFIGRNQLMIEVCELLGKKIPESALQQAVGEDIKERAELLSEIEYNEEISSDDLRVNYALSSLDVYTRTLKIIGKGYEKYILQSDPDLEDRCIKLLYMARDRTLDLAGEDKRENTKTSLSHMEDLSQAQKYLSMFLLGSLLTKDDSKGPFDTTEVQKAWFIRCLIKETQKVVGYFTIFPPDLNELKEYGSEIKKTAEKMLKAGTISNDVFSEIHTTFGKLEEMVARALQQKGQ